MMVSSTALSNSKPTYSAMINLYHHRMNCAQHGPLASYHVVRLAVRVKFYLIWPIVVDMNDSAGTVVTTYTHKQALPSTMFGRYWTK